MRSTWEGLIVQKFVYVYYNDVDNTVSIDIEIYKQTPSKNDKYYSISIEEWMNQGGD